MKKTDSIGKRISYLIFYMLIISMAVVGVFSFFLHRSDSIAYNGQRALAIADALSSAIDPEDMRQVMATREKTPHWYEVKALANEIAVRTAVDYLYVLDATTGDQMTYFLEGFDAAGSEEEEYDLGAKEDSSVYHEDLFTSLSTGHPSITGLYPSGEYGMMVSGFSPILDENGRAVGIVGVDLSVDTVLQASNSFGLKVILIILFFGIVGGLLSRRLMNITVSRPIKLMTEAAQQIAQGDMDISLQGNYRDEIGRLADSFRTMAESTRQQATILDTLAEGDLTVNIAPRSDRDIMSIAMKKMIVRLSDIFGEVQKSTGLVSLGSTEIAAGAQYLAQGATEQAATVDRLADAIASVTHSTQENAARASQAAGLAEAIKKNAEKGTTQMTQMIQAVDEINNASQAIGNVIKSIDEIARQTNLLALNAAVEAARAGQAGKGFAVVADEVRNLAAKSADSARESATLIANSMDKAALGVQIADATATTFDEIVAGIQESGHLVSDIAQSSDAQNTALAEIRQGVDQVALVVQQNTATSEESAAASSHMSDQALALQSLLGRFRLKHSDKD